MCLMSFWGSLRSSCDVMRWYGFSIWSRNTDL
jgi:hypothetical protein